MTHRILLAFALLLILPASAEKPQVAVIDAQRAFAEYYATKVAHKKLARAKLALNKDQRFAVIETTKNELQQLRNKVRDTSLSEEQRELAFKQSEMKAHELRSLERDTRQHIDAEQQKLNNLLVSVTRKLQANVQTAIEQVAAARNVDMVFESGGNTSSQIPTLVYIRDAPDITDVVIKHLNSTDPNPTPPFEVPAGDDEILSPDPPNSSNLAE